jgi:hypothetical protein
MTVRWFRCGSCGADNETGGEKVCAVCGATQPESPDTFEIGLTFAAGECSDCGEHGLPGACPECGGEIGPADPDSATRARVQALAPLGDRARALVESFDSFPKPHISVTASQLAAVVADSRLPDRAIELIQFAHRVQELDLNDPAAIGQGTRDAVVAVLEDVERVRDEARLLAEFEANERVAELPALVARLGRQGAAIVEMVIATLTAESFGDAADASARLQQALEPPAEGEQIGLLLEAIPTLDTPDDIDARISLALGRDGGYTDAFGLPDPVLIFAPPPGESSSFDALAAGASRYLSHLLDRPPEDREAGHAMLALSAVQLALLDRPFEHHRRAELVRELLRRGAQNPESLASALAAYDDHAGLAFETTMRVRRQLRLLATGAVESPVEIVESVVEAYRRFAEGHFRAAMRCVLAARAAVAGSDPPSESLLLGDIEGLLSGWHDELGASLQGVIERHLRNAEAHEEYYVDPESLDVVLPDGTRMTPDELEERTNDLAGTIAAVDAAIACHTIDTERAVVPRWLAEGEHPRFVELILRVVAAGWGMTVETLTNTDGVVTVRVPVGTRLDRPKARTLLFAARPLVPSASALETYEGDRRLAAFGADVIDQWTTAAEIDKQVALLEALYDCAVRCGADPAETLQAAIATCVRAAINESVGSLSSRPSAKQLGRLARRLRSITRFAGRHRAGSIPALAVPLAELRAARDALPNVGKSQDQGRRFAHSLQALSTWADGLTNDWFD